MSLFSPAQITEARRGKTSGWLYRQVKFDDLTYDGLVKYRPELEDLVEDVPTYIAGWLDRQAPKVGFNSFRGRMYSPIEVPLPE